MKKLEILLTVSAISFCLLVGWYAFCHPGYDYEALAATPTTVGIEKDTLQLGEVRYGDKKEVHFRIKNTGSVPLIIRDVRPSCGCTGVKWEKRPIKPGGSGEINITFNPNSLGRFIKNVEVYCNTEEEIINLKLCGNVIE